MSLPVVLLLTLGGCDLVLGLDGRDLPPPEIVSGTVTRHSVINDAMGRPLRQDDFYAPDSISLAVSVGELSRIAVPVGPDGTFSFSRPDAQTPYRLQIAADGRRLELQHTAATLEIWNNSLGRPNDQRAPVTGSTVLAFTPLNSPRLVSTGLWASGFPAAGNDDTQYTIDWQNVSSSSGRRGLLTQAHHDRLYYYDSAVRTGGHTTVNTYLEIADVEIVDAKFHDYTLRPMATAVPDRCVHVAGDLGTQVAGLTAAAPKSTIFSRDWQILAVPNPSIGAMGGFEVAAHRDHKYDAIDATVSLANPFPGTTLLATMGAAASRDIRYPGAMPAPLVASVRSYRVVTAETACTGIVDVSMAIGIPGDPTFDDVLIGPSDDAVITPGLRDTLLLTWPLASPGPVDRYLVSLYEIEEDPQSGLTISRLLREVVTVEPGAAIDAGVLVPGSYYSFVVAASTGYLGAREGDMATITYPADQAVIRSGLFRVQ